MYRLPMMGVSAAVTRVSFRRGSTVGRLKTVAPSLMGSTGGRPRHFFNGINRILGNERFTPVVRRGENESTDDCDCARCKHYQAWAKTLEFEHKTDGLHIKVEMPGVEEKNVKVYVEETFVICEGVGELDPEFKYADEEVKKENTPKYRVKVKFGPLRFYKVDGIESKLENGILKVKVPKLKHEERTDILHVQVK